MDGAHLVLIDETGCFLNPLVRRTWAVRGRTPVLGGWGRHREKVSVIGAVSVSPAARRLGLYFATDPRDFFDAAKVVGFLCDLLRHLRGKVVWDRGANHKGPVVRAFLARNRRLRLEHLPGYAPDLNPVEAVWAWLKYAKLANFVPRDVHDLNEWVAEFRLDDRVKKFLPAFSGDGRDAATVRHLLTHTSGLPDQLANNSELRKRHAPLTEFAKETVRTKLDFAPGTSYQYSSMGILLAARIAEEISGTDILNLVDRAVFQPLGMKHSAQGLGRFKPEEMVPCQTDGAAPESGGGDPKAKEWDWNSPYWRKLGAPWGGTHASAPDVAAFLGEFLGARGRAVKPETARLMVGNQNPEGLTPRGLGFGVGKAAGSVGCSDRTFGHTGSTGTLCWADPATETVCVVLTSLPRRGADRHPRDLAAERGAAAGR